MSDNVIPLNGAKRLEASESSKQCAQMLRHLLSLAETGELTGFIGIVQSVNDGIGEVSVGGTNLHPYATLGALEVLTLKHKLATIQNSTTKPAFMVTEGPSDAPTES